MSKSNLKNINDLLLKKTPYLVFNKSCYSNLLLKLKKSTVWKLNQICILNCSFSDYNENFQALRIKKYDTSFQNINKQFSRQTDTFKYNPNTTEFLDNSLEYFFFKKVYKFRVTFEGRKLYREVVKPFYYSSKLNNLTELDYLRDDLKNKKH